MCDHSATLDPYKDLTCSACEAVEKCRWVSFCLTRNIISEEEAGSICSCPCHAAAATVAMLQTLAAV